MLANKALVQSELKSPGLSSRKTRKNMNIEFHVSCCLFFLYKCYVSFIQRSAAAVAEMAETVWQATRAAEEGQCQTGVGIYYHCILSHVQRQ